jgi:hypothetical protein
MMRVAFLACALSACGLSSMYELGAPARCRVVHASTAFPPEERAAVRRATERWNEIAIEQYCVVDGDGPNAIRPIVWGDDEWTAISQAHGGAQIYGEYNGARIVVVTGLDAYLFEAVVLHELGHAHGLGHAPAPAIMAAGAGTAYDFTMNDLDECIRVGACL